MRLPRRFFRSRGCRTWVRKANSTPWNMASSISQKSFFKTSRGQVIALRAFSLPKSSLPPLRPNRLLQWPEFRKCFQMAFRHHEIPFHWSQHSWFVTRSEGRLRVFRAIVLLKTSLMRLPSRFFRSRGYRTWVRKANSTPWIMASSISQNSLFKTSKGQIMCSQSCETTWNIIFEASTKSLFWMPRM
jgi:hypothetical protein